MYHATVGNRKTDLVAINDDTALLIDAQLRGNGVDLDNAHDVKARYYGRNPDLARKIRQRHPADTTLDYTSVTLNWRGVFSLSQQILSLAEESSDESFLQYSFCNIKVRRN